MGELHLDILVDRLKREFKVEATHTGDIQDRDGGPDVIRDALKAFDGPTIETVKRPKDVTGFVIIARRWVVERTFAWLGRCRRLAKDWEISIASSDAWTLIASIRRSVRYATRKIAPEF